MPHYENTLYLCFPGSLSDAGLRGLHRTSRTPQGEAPLWIFTSLETDATYMDFSLNGIPDMTYLQWTVSHYLFLTQNPHHLWASQDAMLAQ